MKDLVPIIQQIPPKELREAFGSTLSDLWQATIGDRISAFRLKNAAMLNNKLTEHLEAQGLELNRERLPERFALRWFDRATQEDDPLLQDLFAKLLASASAGSKDALDCRNLEFVSAFQPEDALLLDKIYKDYWKKIDSNPADTPWLDCLDDFERAMKGASPVFSRKSFEHLLRLGILEVERYSEIDQTRLENWLQERLEPRNGQWYSYLTNELILWKDQVNITQSGSSLLRALYSN